MKKIILILSTLVLASCGREADQIKLESKTFKTPFTSSFTAKGSSFDDTVRGVTLIAYPKANEIKNFSYKLNDNLFNTVFNSTYTKIENSEGTLSYQELKLATYGNRMVNGVEASVSADVKVQQFVSQLVNVGDMRDRAYEAFVKNEEVIAPIKQEVLSIEENLFTELKFYKIRKTPEGMEQYKRKFVLSKLDGYKVKSQKTSSCDQLAKRYKKVAFDLLDPEESTLLENSVTECEGLSETIKEVSKASDIQSSLIFNGEMISTSSIFYKGKEYITEILNDLENATGLKYLFTGIAKESVLDSTYSKDRAREGISKIRFNDEGTAFEKFSLELEISDGAQTYSVDNGKISNLRIEEMASGAKMVYFSIIDETVVVNLELGASTMDRMGLRLIGDAYFNFSDGRKSRGVMKIELDAYADKGFNFEL